MWRRIYMQMRKFTFIAWRMMGVCERNDFTGRWVELQAETRSGSFQSQRFEYTNENFWVSFFIFKPRHILSFYFLTLVVKISLHSHTNTHAHIHKHTRTHTPARTHKHTRTRSNTHTDPHTQTHTHTHARAHARAHTHTHTQTHTHTHAHTHKHTHTRPHTCTHARAHTQTHTRAGTRTGGRAHTHTRAHTCTHKHTSPHTNTHAHTNAHTRTHKHTAANKTIATIHYVNLKTTQTVLSTRVSRLDETTVKTFCIHMISMSVKLVYNYYLWSYSEWLRLYVLNTLTILMLDV